MYQWPETKFQKVWTRIKIFLKESLFYGDWKASFINRNVGGKWTLSESVSQGLRELKVDFLENDYSLDNVYKVCYVLRDVRCLNWALEQKKQGRIQTLVVGPMIVNLPSEEDYIIESPLIDTYILPSQWIVNLFISLNKGAVNYKVWPLGVDIQKWTPQPHAIRNEFLIYVKDVDVELPKEIEKVLKCKKIKFETIYGGFFKQNYYRDKLMSAKAVIFLSRSETQGLAMLEAWACGVPTLHWNPKNFRYMKNTYSNASSCPYLSEECGLEFYSSYEFEAILNAFLEKYDQFQPRKYVENNFELKATLQRLLEM